MLKYPFHSLDDFLKSSTLDVDGQVNDGWGAPVSIKGRSFQGAVLFADISGFSRHTKDLTPTETLVFVNTFFSWMSAEGLRATHGIIDKYIGDEMMVVFAREFGSKDPVNDAVNSARWMIENDVLEYRPRIGIAYGDMIAGYVGTPLAFNASVFGQPVTLAARCCSTQRQMNGSGGIVMPASTWAGRTIETVMTPVLSDHPDQGQVALPIDWTVGGRRSADLKNIGEVEILELCHLEANDGGTFVRFSAYSLDQRVKDSFKALKAQGGIHPIRFRHDVDWNDAARD